MIELIPAKITKPHCEVTFHYTVGDDEYTRYNFNCSLEEVEEIVKFVSILNRLQSIKYHSKIVFEDYYSKYPGEYIGVSEEEYNLFMEVFCYTRDLTDMEEEINYCLRDNLLNDSTYLAFNGADIYYYDENSNKYYVKYK